MKIVIDINEDRYKSICDGVEAGKRVNVPSLYAHKIIANGKPLPDDAIIIDAKEQSDYVFVEKAKYNDLVEAASKALTDRIKKSLHKGGTDDNDGMLEQEPILDKIRAEIADLDDADYDYEGYYKAVTDAVKIIDKYKTESEGKE